MDLYFDGSSVLQFHLDQPYLESNTLMGICIKLKIKYNYVKDQGKGLACVQEVVRKIGSQIYITCIGWGYPVIITLWTF